MTLIDHKKAYFDYEILEKIEAGIVLKGFEVKSLKLKRGSLEGAYVLVRAGQAEVCNMLIPPYQEKNAPADYDPRHPRKLIISKNEIIRLSSTSSDRKGLTIVPISVYLKGDLIKLGIAVVRGKKKYDKRETTKKRETEREMNRIMKDR